MRGLQPAVRLIAVVAIAAASMAACSRRSTVSQLETGKAPYDIAITADAVWVVNITSSTLTRIDRRTSRVVASTRVGSSPDGVIATDRGLWVTSTSDNALYRVSPVTNRVVQRVDVPTAVTPRSGLRGDVWVGGLPVDHVTAFNPLTGAIDAVLPLRGAAWVTQDSSVWVGSVLANTVSRLDPATGALEATVPLSDPPWRLATGADAIWVTSFSGGKLFRIDPSSNRVTATIAIRGHPNGVAVSGDGSVWVASHVDSLLPRRLRYVDPRPVSGYLTVVDPVRNRVVRTFDTGQSLNGALALAGRDAWIANYGSNSVERFRRQP